MKTDFITIPRLKKDGTFDRTLMKAVAEAIAAEKLVMMPVDSIYGYAALVGTRSYAAILKHTGKNDPEVHRLVSSFRMLESTVTIGKKEFDFLHRVWPAELIAHLPSNEVPSATIPVRMPRHRYLLDILETVGRPVGFVPLMSRDGTQVYRPRELQRAAEGFCDCACIINEFCKKHMPPTVIDISRGSLEILHEGRLSADELKSLYFLGSDEGI